MDPVIVVGAGPVGLTLSLALAAQGVPSVVLDEGPGTEEPRPARTVVLREDTADLLGRLGCRELDRVGLRWAGWRSMRRKQLVRNVPLSGGRRDEDEAPLPGLLPAPLHVPQHALSGALRAAVDKAPLVQRVPMSRIDTLEQDPDGITVHTREPGSTWWRGSYLVGCDGARSTVRKLLDIRFPGRTAVERHAVAALRAELPWPDEAVLHRQPPWRTGGAEVSARPLPDGVWRLDWLLPPRGELVTPEALITRIRDTLAGWCGETPAYELLDTGVHTLHHRLARRWRKQRAFLAGDAAHLLGAVGTQGLDEGVRDAENLAWKLAHAWHHGPAEHLLDSYQAERRAAVAARLRAADQSLPILRGGGGLRTLVPGAARGHDTLLSDGHLGCGALGAPPSYSHSPFRRRTPRRTPSSVRPRCAGRRRDGDGAGRNDGASAGAARSGPPAGDPGRAGNRCLGPAALADRRRHAPPHGGRGGAARGDGAAGHRELPGGIGPHRPAGQAGRAPGGGFRRCTARRAVRRGTGRSGRCAPRSAGARGAG